MTEPVLIYNLFPLLIGAIPRWEEHLSRIAAMGFTWIYVNPIHTPGLSGSLYAVKDYFGINPLFWPEGGEEPQEALRHFLQAAAGHGLRVMLDLVINHTAIDSPLTVEHPEWYARDEEGRIRHPGCIDPADASKKTVWGDLAELEYWPVPDPEGLLAYWGRVVSHYMDLGFGGFRADAAYKIPGWFWGRLIEQARRQVPGVQFFAETLGCRLEECAQLADAGFDFLYNSSKWWDFQADWCLAQYNQFRHIAPSVSFPETHDTERLAAESGGREEVARLRYLFAAYFSAAVMIPVGFEFGFTKRLHVVRTRPTDWEEPTYDLSGYITSVNSMKKAVPGLLEEGPMIRLTPPGEPVVVLVKGRDAAGGVVLAVINPTAQPQGVVLAEHLARWPEPLSQWADITPGVPPLTLGWSSEYLLSPYEMRLVCNAAGVLGDINQVTQRSPQGS